MVDPMIVLGAAATAKLTGDRLVREFVEYIRRNTRVREHALRTPIPLQRNRQRLSRTMKQSATTGSSSSRKRQPSRRSKRLSLLTDADLEAELENRRRRRAKERSNYSRAMPSDKLATLESELLRLRRELSRIDGSNAVSRSQPLRPVTSNVPRLSPCIPNTSLSPPSQTTHIIPTTPLPPSSVTPALAAPSKAPRSGGPPPPPPPPPPMASGNVSSSIDPERQKQEKIERQKRREAKKKEREEAQSKQKLTLADIIRSAGPDPTRHLKPASKKAADEEREKYEQELKEREEREKTEEQQRVEAEKKALLDMSKRLSPSPVQGDKGKSMEKEISTDEESSRGKEKIITLIEDKQEQNDWSKNSGKPKDTPAKTTKQEMDKTKRDVGVSIEEKRISDSTARSEARGSSTRVTKDEKSSGTAPSTKRTATSTKPP
ncbi:unnamed protein product [Agarophyton chilense]